MERDPTVTINQGKLLGKINIAYQGNRYYSFQGIPYAEPPLGNLRFKAPRPPKSWEGTRDATKEGERCFSKHISNQSIGGSEDCLFLNVFTPQLPSKNKELKAVMVWIHGGAFLVGSGGWEFHQPDFFIAEDVIIVTINYRLGLLGFLSLDDPDLEITGNAGLKDQVMALMWVRDNISKFGGNPNNVTIFGESAGGVCVHALILSTTAKGLFHTAIIQSGCAFIPWQQVGDALPLLTKNLGLETTDTKKVLTALTEMPVEKLFELQGKLESDITTASLMGPAIEKPTAKFPFIVQEPLDIILSKNYNHVPIMIGFTSREGMLFDLLNRIKYGDVKLVTDFETEIPYVMKVQKGSGLSKTISEKIKAFYYGKEVPSNDNINQYYLLKGDNFFVWSTYAAVKHHCSTSQKPVYLYRMSVESTLNLTKKVVGTKNPGVCHGDDVRYLFKTDYTPPIIPNSIEDKSIKRFTRLWSNFAKTGNPNSINKDVLINVHWKPTQPEEFHFMDIGENLTVGKNPEEERILFWKEIFSLSPYTKDFL
ncbi:hypothetical protein RI129_002601 [Pyrocoelia pectoralis]|uniref:Carboxylic ester hydrolase n=1 Tax=Pyrocoelia pectoralis TaxID=417401 RepID=A0AAN7VJ65_9COLE